MGFLSDFVGDVLGTNDAAQAGLDANYQGMKAEREMYDISRGDMLEERGFQRARARPWIEGGLASMGMYDESARTVFNFDLASDPVYGVRIAELDKILSQGQSAKGMKFSGSTLSQLRDATATEVGSAYGRQFDRYQANLSNLFQSAQMGSTMQQSLMGSGGATAANMAGQAQQQGSNAAQGFQNQGAIRAQQATAPFQNLLAIGQTAGSIMAGIK
jgi:hypothetical protein